METYDVIVIGGGPGGYVAAIRAAQLGGKVALIERDSLGGTCLNRGCIPTKALLHSTGYLGVPEQAAKCGVKINIESFDINKIVKHKEQAVGQLVRGINGLIAKNKVDLLRGHGSLIDRNTVEITTQQGVVREKTKNIIISTGSKPVIIKVPGCDLPGVITSDEALNPKKVPKSMVIIGGGAVGIELAFVYRNLGSEVAVVEMMTQLMPQMDYEIISILEKALKQRGIQVYKDTKLQGIKEKEGLLNIELSSAKSNKTIAAEQVLLAAGRAPVTEGLNLDKVGVKTDKGKIVVDRFLETDVKGIFAIGDVIGGILLAHVASAEGMTAAENSLGARKAMDYKVVPGCVYTTPEAAGVGLTEKEAIEQGYQVKIGRFPLAACGKTVAMGATEGLVKIVADERYGEILGVHMIGERATDIIAEAALGMRLEATVDELVSTIHAHPTIAESVFEAAHAVFGHCIHQ